MFEILPRQWTPVLPLAEATGNPVALEVAGERLVAFRDGEGAWHALLDRCPHRSALLSRGTVQPDGTLRCAYHGWRFRGDGRCARVPLNELPDRALAHIRVAAVPARALAGALWVFTGAEAPGEPVLPPSLQGPAERFGTYTQEWAAHWTRAVENFIDFAHPAYVHTDTIGAYTLHYAEGGATGFSEVTPTEWGFRTVNGIGRRGGGGFRLDWYRPNLSVLHFGHGDEANLHVFSIPLDAARTRVMTVRRLPAGTDALAWSRRNAGVDSPILSEDRAVVESQPGPVPDEGEISVATDAPSVAFRRWYHDAVRGAAATAG